MLADNRNSWRFCVAPMMKYTDTNFRFFARLLSSRARLYTEMVVASAIVKGDRARFLQRDQGESPVALQLGGSNPSELAEAAYIAEQSGFDEININVGCPSDRVQSGEFGACLMAKPQVVSNCVEAVRRRVRIPVTVKTRIGIDDNDSYGFLQTFIVQVMEAGIDALIIHARKAILSGLSPAENRTIPELRPEVVYTASSEFPRLPVIINGGLKSLADCEFPLTRCAGVMLGRAACANPYLLSQVDSTIFGDSTPPPARHEVLVNYLAYIERFWGRGRSKQMMIKPLYGLYQNCPGAKQWRRNLNEALHRADPPSVDQLVPEELAA
ncbi:MAG: tRNA dihydrouridine(20/20a) synthase DusA [Gammaproteobacteria bacterium]